MKVKKIENGDGWRMVFSLPFFLFVQYFFKLFILIILIVKNNLLMKLVYVLIGRDFDNERVFEYEAALLFFEAGRHLRKYSFSVVFKVKDQLELPNQMVEF